MENLRTYKIDLRRQFVRQNTNAQKNEWYEFRKKISNMIKVATRIANYVIQPDVKYEKISSKDVKKFGKLKSTIANQVIRK